jgi:hypothetical protein
MTTPIIAAFDAAADSYDAASKMQRDIARELVFILPSMLLHWLPEPRQALVHSMARQTACRGSRRRQSGRMAGFSAHGRSGRWLTATFQILFLTIEQS